ncbi:hypothetical protein [Halobacterium zhouii]|uniref:hypothetical protein n=1 Tax=Halobacterium zhouii TaxID=2902624 RepID=UPI001E31D747|nr:hypothetical protein [Halobacterium zhouii]
MTFVEERSVELDTPDVECRSWHSDGRYHVSQGGRIVTFRPQGGCVRVVGDTGQDGVVTPDGIPDEVRNHVLSIGWRIHGAEVADGGFTLLSGDVR